MSYVPPTSRQEAADEILKTGFTVSAMLAVCLAFPLPTELEEIVAMHERANLSYWLEEACVYLSAWGKGSCEVQL